ncbi:MAG: glycine cleavage system aminomethyltransferase GcvT, partial [Candidatus Aminicenantes bacterium]|nr:glycine cleavage system aminomethyltransferase GcvT [Candidatus Aminicenantes bacterium]
MKRTRFYEAHRRLQAKFIEFFGWEMPIEYSGIVSEHLAVRQRAGLFDVSHMGEIIISGPDALTFIQYLTPNDVARLSPGQAQYSACL